MSTLEKKPRPNPAAPSPVRSAAGGWNLRSHAIRAIFDRNFQAYFSNPAGYVFITLFVLVGAWAAFWRPEFFTSNQASLSTLNDWMPYLLLFFVPAITMSTWAEERRQGTDELLLTLPARDVEIVLGKYLAALGIYTVALAFSLTHVAILAWLGSPDLGIMASTFLGYWLMGALMIAIGLVASLLSSNVTVGFILGGLFAAIPVFSPLIGLAFNSGTRRSIEDLSIPSQFRDFGTGVISASGVFYFLSLAAAMLYLNMILIGRRHWAGGERSRGLVGHSLVRVLALVVALVGLNVVISRAGARHDNSEEKLFTLSRESNNLIGQIPTDKPVYIQAYYSPEVPREFVEAKANLLGLLREYAALGGARIRLNLVETELYSNAAREAQKRFGIEPKRVVSNEEARQSASEIFLGVAFTSGLEEVVVPFFDPGLPTEYELTRSIRVVSKSGRKKVGVLATDAKMLGGFDFRSMGQEHGVAVRHRAEEAVRGDVGRRRRADPRRPRRPPRRPAVVDDPEADRRPGRLRPGRPPFAPVPRPGAPDQPFAQPRGPQAGPRRPVRWRRPARAQGEHARPARPPGDRLAGQRDRLERLQPAPVAARDLPRVRLRRRRERRPERLQPGRGRLVGPPAGRDALPRPDPLEGGQARGDAPAHGRESSAGRSGSPTPSARG